MAENDSTVRYSWSIEVRRWNEYGDRIVSVTPTTVIAATRSEVTTKVLAMFEARYDSFRKFWSHSWALISVSEVAEADEREVAR